MRARVCVFYFVFFSLNRSRPAVGARRRAPNPVFPTMNASRELSHTQIAATSGDGDSPEVGVCDRSGVELLREEVVALSAQVATLTQKLLEVDALRRRDADALRQVEALSYSVQQQVSVLKAPAEPVPNQL